MEFPHMALIEQQFDVQKIDDIEAFVVGQISKLNLGPRIKEGESIAVTAGSRGIVNIQIIIRAVVEELKKLGGQPFVFPAMGSHGGATAEGQIKVLTALGITEDFIKCPVKSDMQPDYLGTTSEEYPIYIDRNAMAADHIVVINRIKAHTKFEGPLESGLMKMMAIGMGKQKGASYYHKAAVRLTFPKIIETVGGEIIKRCPILFGLGIVENAFHQTCQIKGLLPDEILEGEQELLNISKRRMARLPFNNIDILIIDQVGKDISGIGMDSNVTGRNRDLIGDFTTHPNTKRVYVRDLTDASEGNANGIGLADFTSTRLVNKMDRKKTYMNAITGISPEKAAIPIYFDSDREVLEAAFSTIGDIPPAKARVVHIRNTNDIHRISVSQAYIDEIKANPALTINDEWRPMHFDDLGTIDDPFTKSSI
jgi:hypothetical protein